MSPRKAAPQPEPTSDRPLPHNLEAEKAVLGAVLVNNAAWHVASQLLAPESFYRNAHRIIFRAFREIIDERQSVADLVTLKAAVQRAGNLDDCGGPSYLSALTDGVPRSSNIAHYASIVQDLARRRSLIALGAELLESSYGDGQTIEIIRKADQDIVNLQRGSTIGAMTDLRASSAGLYEELERRASTRGQLTGQTTGFPTIDALTGGWQRGDMVVIAARPSIGKTVFTLNTADHGAEAGARVAIFSLEMRQRQLELRRLSSLSGVPLTRIMRGDLGEVDYERMAGAMGQLGERAVFVDDRAGRTVWDIRAACRRLKSEGGLDLVVVDYIQLVAGTLDRRGATRAEELADVSRRLKLLADEVQVTILVVSQLSRAGDSRADKRPILSDLRDTGALEQDADMVCFLHRADHKASGNTELLIEKARNGPTGTVMLSIDRETQTFTEAPERSEEPAADDDPKPPPGFGGRRRRRG